MKKSKSSLSGFLLIDLLISTSLLATTFMITSQIIAQNLRLQSKQLEKEMQLRQAKNDLARLKAGQVPIERPYTKTLVTATHTLFRINISEKEHFEWIQNNAH